MGKRRLEELKAKFPEPQKNLNPQSNDIFFEYIRAQKIVAKSKQYRTVALRHIRKYMRKIAEEQRRHLKLRVFGYWKYWILEGKIGILEEDEPNLLHP